MTNKIAIPIVFVRRSIIMALTAKITLKGQITLPKEVRKLLNVKEAMLSSLKRKITRFSSNRQKPFAILKVY